MARALLDRAGEAEQTSLVERRHRLDLRDLGAAHRERAGLVEHRRVHRGERLERAAVPHDDLAAGRAVDPADDRHRYREDERARRGHHQDREHPERISGDKIRRERHCEGQRGEPDRVPVGHPLNRRLARLGGADQLDDAGVEARLGARGGAQHEGTIEVERAGLERHAGLGADRERLAGQPGGVHLRGARLHHPVARHHLPRAHQQPVAHFDGIDRDVHGPRPRQPVRLAGCLGLERAHGRRRAALGERLERFAAGLHEDDDQPGEGLVERHRAHDREPRDEVGREAAAQRVAGGPEEQRDADEPEPHGPDRVGRDRRGGENAERQPDQQGRGRRRRPEENPAGRFH